MKKIRVLVVDDAVVIRRMLTEILSSDPKLEVAGTAPNGRIALARIPQLNPDLVTLDIEMPEMDGLETLREIRKTYPRLPVIMFSTLTQRAAAATLDALALGANDYVTKPANVGSVGAAIDSIRTELVPKIKAFCGPAAGIESPEVIRTTPALPAQPRPKRAAGPPPRVDVVAIGVSTGGPNTLAEILPTIPRNFPVPVLVVQHMPPLFTKMLAERLDAQTHLRIAEGQAGQIIRRGEAWIAPGGYHMVVERQGASVRLQLNEEPPVNSCRPAVDVLFRSVTKVYGQNVLAVVLTGMGQDGLRGCEDIHESGGQIIVQDEATSVVWGMPGYVAEAGLARNVLPKEKIGGEIIRAVMEKRAAGAYPPAQEESVCANENS